MKVLTKEQFYAKRKKKSMAVSDEMIKKMSDEDFNKLKRLYNE